MQNKKKKKKDWLPKGIKKTSSFDCTFCNKTCMIMIINGKIIRQEKKEKRRKRKRKTKHEEEEKMMAWKNELSF